MKWVNYEHTSVSHICRNMGEGGGSPIGIVLFKVWEGLELRHMGAPMKRQNILLIWERGQHFVVWGRSQIYQFLVS